MPGAETLLPYVNDKKKPGEEPTIIIDSREASSAAKIATGLIEHGANVQKQMLEKGDYVLSDQCAVERKTVNDFVYTLTQTIPFRANFHPKRGIPEGAYCAGGIFADHLQVQQHSAQRDLGRNVQSCEKRHRNS